MIRSLDITRVLRRRPKTSGCSHFGLDCSFLRLSYSSAAHRGFSLVEVMICLVIVMMAGFATIGAITYTRLNMELEKQRLAALNYCRQAMEAVQSLDDAYASTKPLVPFNAPGIEDLNANIKVEYYKLQSSGAVDWTTSVTAPLIDQPVFARVSVKWLPYGSVAREQEVSMSTILTRGID